jgi:hypothetical protein
MVLETIKYNEHKWSVCCDLKYVAFCWANKEATLKVHVSCANGTAKPEKNIGQLHFGLKEKVKCHEQKV